MSYKKWVCVHTEHCPYLHTAHPKDALIAELREQLHLSKSSENALRQENIQLREELKQSRKKLAQKVSKQKLSEARAEFKANALEAVKGMLFRFCLHTTMGFCAKYQFVLLCFGHLVSILALYCSEFGGLVYLVV